MNKAEYDAWPAIKTGLTLAVNAVAVGAALAVHAVAACKAGEQEKNTGQR